MERMDEYRMASRVLMADVSGGRVRRRPRLSLMDGVNEALIKQQRNDGGGCATMHERSKKWRALVHTIYVTEFHVPIFAWHCCGVRGA